MTAIRTSFPKISALFWIFEKGQGRPLPYLPLQLRTCAAQYLKTKKQSENETWSGTEIEPDKFFSSEIMQKMRQRD